MSVRGQFSRHRLIAALITAATIAMPASNASAQGIFDTLFGAMRRQPPSYDAPPPARAYAPPSTLSYPARSDPAPSYRAPASGGRGTVFCVRLCDGRYFPMARHADASAAEVCQALCPASATRTFSGGDISYAVAPDGTRYANLRTAFAYRKQAVAGCTCNGRDAFGLMPLKAADDPTLRDGDIVATHKGFVAYQSHGDAAYTPVENHRGLSAEMQRKLSQTQVMPARIAVPETPPAADDHTATIDARLRAQLDK